MKKLCCILLVSAIAFSCKKNNGGAEMDEPVPNPHNSIFGEWMFSEYYVSPGYTVDWVKADHGTALTIKEDSTYNISGSANTAYWPFTRLGSEGKLGVYAKVIWGSNPTYFVKKGTVDSVFFHPVRVNKDTLELAGFCIEGCVYRFRKTK